MLWRGVVIHSLRSTADCLALDHSRAVEPSETLERRSTLPMSSSEIATACSDRMFQNLPFNNKK